MRYSIGVTVTFAFDVEIEFDGTKEEFAALSREDRERIAYPAVQEAWDSDLNLDNRFKRAEEWMMADICEVDDPENLVELD